MTSSTRFSPVLSDDDLNLFAQGNHTRLYEKLGAHPLRHQGVEGVGFAVWAPNARCVSVVGDFNQWDGGSHPMRVRGASGIWELFVPALRAGELYKYEIIGADGCHPVLKADPHGFACELRPQTASVVCALPGFHWGDYEWMAARPERQSPTAPISVYELHPGSWWRAADGSPFSYRELAPKLVQYVLQLGFTHVELLPVTEHPLDGSWGYQTLGYFAPTSRHGCPHDFMAFVNSLHCAGIGVILDWVPAHFPRDEHGLSLFDGTHLYEHADPRRGAHPDWGTLVFDYGRREVVQFLLNSALFWLEKYHIDGLRVDAVSSMLYLDYSRKEGEWLPNERGGRENLEAVAFMRRFNQLVHERHAGALTIAEESTTWPKVTGPLSEGGLGFDLKWNLGWMHDTLGFFGREPAHRRHHYDQLTCELFHAFDESFMLPFSHDEVVHGKGSLLGRMPGNRQQQFANLRLLFAYMYTHPGKKLLFMGNEFGQAREWDHDNALDWERAVVDPHRQLQRLLGDLNRLYRAQPALHELDSESGGFERICFQDAESGVLVFMRRARDSGDWLLVAFNLTQPSRDDHCIGVPQAGRYRELLNTDAAIYGGSDLCNLGAVATTAVACDGHPQSLALTLPPLGAIVLKTEQT